MNEVSIKDYILEKDEGTITTSTGVTYSVKICSGCDFVISRKTQKTDKELVFIVSQSQYYIKDNKNDTNMMLENPGLYNFLKDLSEPLKLNASWIKTISRENAKQLLAVTQIAGLKEPLKKGFDITTLLHEDGYLRVDLSMLNFAVKKPKLYELVKNLYGNEVSALSQGSLLRSVLELATKYGDDIARHYIELLYVSNYNQSSLERSQLAYNINELITQSNSSNSVKNFLKYILIDTYRMGYRDISSACRNYTDYISNQKKYYEKIKEKYPENLYAAHMKLSAMCGDKHRLISQQKFTENIESEKYERLVYKGSKYSIIKPLSAEDLINEGSALNHCVGSYSERVANGECFILFGRNNDKKNESLFTIEIRGNIITQAKRENDKQLTQEQLLFLQEYAAKKKLTINSYL